MDRWVFSMRRVLWQYLEDDTLFLYLMTKEYDPQRERCVRWDDPQLAIPWPIKEAIVSEKDSKCPPLGQAETNFEYP